MERRLGQISQVVTAGSDSHIKLSWDTVYDIPLLGSLKQQLVDEHILNEVRNTCTCTCMHALYWWVNTDMCNHHTIHM